MFADVGFPTIEKFYNLLLSLANAEIPLPSDFSSLKIKDIPHHAYSN